MTKAGFWKTDWFLGDTVVIFIVLFNRLIRPDLPPALVAFLEKAMAKHADERYQTGDEFAVALRAAFGGGAAAAASGGGVDMDISL
jgi:hypothetical protein